MKILTPIQSIMLTIKKKISREDFLILQKEFLNVYAEGYISGDKRSTSKKIKASILASNLWAELNNNDLMTVFK